MSKPWSERPLWMKLYCDEDKVFLMAARIIGYGSRSPTEFYDIARTLPNWDAWRYEQAVLALTDWKKREAPTLRYELTAHARKCVRVLLGPAPDDPEFAGYWSREVFQPGMTAPWKPGMKPGETEAWYTEAEEKPAGKAPKKVPAPKERRKPPAKKPSRKKAG